MDNFTRYTFDGKACTNKALGTPVTVQKLENGREFYMLTNNQGKRERLYLDLIPEVVVPTVKEKKVRSGKLDMKKAKAIRDALFSGTKVKQLATDYGVNESAIYDIKSGRLYNDGSIVYTGKR